MTYCQQAAGGAHNRAAFREAVGYYCDQALQTLVHLPEQVDTMGLAIDLRLAFEARYTLLGEFGRWLVLLGEAEALARVLLDDRARAAGRVLANIGQVRRTTGDHDGAIAACRQTLELAVEVDDGALQGEYPGTWGSYTMLSATAVRRPNCCGGTWRRVTPEPGTYSTDVWLQSQAWLARILRCAWGLHRGAAPRRRGTPPGHAEGRGVTPIIARGCLGLLYLAQGDLEHSIRMLEPGLALCRASGNRAWCDRLGRGLGFAYALQGLSRGGTSAAGGSDQRVSTRVRCKVMPPRSRQARSGVWRDTARRPGSARQALDLAQQLQGTREQERMRCTSLALSRPRRSSRGRAGRSPLPAGPGRGTRHAPAQAHATGLGTLYAATEVQREQARTN